MSDNYNAKRLANNTLLLYGRMLITMWLNLWATRLMLQNLGATDMGIYGVIGSIVTLFAIFTNSISTAENRFITYEIGLGKNGNVQSVFSTLITISVPLAILIAILLELIGPYCIRHHLINIPDGSEQEAIYAFHGVIISFICSFLLIPFQSLVTAHEKMNFFAIVSILQVAATCAATYFLLGFSSHRLTIYSLSLAAIAFAVLLSYYIYCKVCFNECKLRFSIDKIKFKEITHFISATFLGGLLDISVSQGIILVINWTFGVIINAVYTIALQVKNMVLAVTNAVLKALQPQVTKTFAEGDYDTYRKLTYSGAKAQLYMVSFVMLPFLFRTDQIMNLWLGEGMVPEYAVSFARCTIFVSLCYSLINPIYIATLATGIVKQYLITPSAFSIVVIPLSYIVARYTGNPNYLIIVVVAVDLIACIIRVYIATKTTPLETKQIIKSVIVPYCKVALLTIVFYAIGARLIPQTFIGLITYFIIVSIIYSVGIYSVGINDNERKAINNTIFKLRSCSKSPIV